MPGMSGRELAARLLTQRPGTPVLYASGYDEEMVAERASLDPEIHYLAKPYTAAQFLERIQTLLEGAAPPVSPTGADGPPCTIEPNRPAESRPSS